MSALLSFTGMNDEAAGGVWLDILRHLPTENIVCSVRLAHPELLELVDSDAAEPFWIERRNYLLTHVSPQDYPQSIVEREWVSVQWPESNDAVQDVSSDGTPESEQEQKTRIQRTMPKVRVVKPLNREICQEFVKAAHQKWHTEYVLRSWRKRYLQTVGPLADFWDRKWNERETAEINGVESNDPLVANPQIDIEEMCRNLYEARRSTLLRTQYDETDRALEQRFFREHARKRQLEDK